MSNIVDGHDIGMGYEKATVRGPGVQMLLYGRWTAPVDPNYEIKAGVLHRRPLPIISQHPGAIPLEPGEEPKVGGRYLTRDGRDTGVLVDSQGHLYPLWSDLLRCSFLGCGKYRDVGSHSDQDIIASLPKVEQREPEKAKEEKKMESLINIGAVHYADFHGTPANFRIPVIEAARIAQLPQVIAEVERQRAEKEIKVGDWFWTTSGTPDRAHAIGSERFEILGQTDKWHKVQDCTKITDPTFIALLERGV